MTPRTRARATPGAVFAALAVLLGLASAHPALAQFTPPTPPTITFSPTTQSQPMGDLSVVITWTDNVAISGELRYIAVNDSVVTDAFTYDQLTATTAQSTGTLRIRPGNNVLVASICDGEDVPGCATASITYVGPTPSVQVTPDGATAQHPEWTAAVETFLVRNTGSFGTAFQLQGVCVSDQLADCAASRDSIHLAAGDSGMVAVTYNTQQGGLVLGPSPRVMLRAYHADVPAAGDSAWYDFAFDTTLPEASPANGMVGAISTDTRLDRGACVVVAAGPAAYECGDLRLAQGLPATRVLNTSRAPTLVYNSQHAQPHPVIGIPFSPTSFVQWPFPTVTQVQATVTMNGITVAQRTWSGLSIPTPWYTDAPPPVYRFALDWEWDVTNPQKKTGIHPYTVQVTATYSNGTVEVRPPVNGELVVVNRHASPFGAGWWVAGLEQLHFVTPDTADRLWVGGDGSHRLYRRVTSTTWAADAWDRPDTLRYEPASAQYVRTLPGRVEVWFDGAGRHLRTVNAAGHWSEFEWNPTTARLTRIHLPQASNFDTHYSYLFEYNNPGGRLSRVVAPGTNRTVTVGMNAGRVTTITTPDTQSVVLAYTGTSTVPATVAKPGGSVTAFAFDGARRLARVSNTMGTPSDTTDDIAFRFRAAESEGTVSPVDEPNLYTLLDGPRADADVLDHTRLWLDRRGTPVRVINAVGDIIWVQRGDARWPGLVTTSRAGTGVLSTATYDVRGNPLSTTVLNPYGDGRNATTLYRFDPVWDAVTWMTAPEGEVVQVGYDAAGRRAWEQRGNSASRRVWYGYHPSTSATAPGLLSTITHPTPAGGTTAVEEFEYDARGNLSAVETPLGIRSTMLSDAIGRTYLTVTPTDSLHVRRDSVVFDVMDRPLRTYSTGQPGGSRVEVWNAYDAAGNLTSVSRRSVPDPLQIGWVTTGYRYDIAGRMVAEVAPDGLRDSVIYNPAGQVVATRSRRHAEFAAAQVGSTDSLRYIRMEYDALGRLERRITPPVLYAKRASGMEIWPILLAREGYPFFPESREGLPGYRIAGDTATYAYGAHGQITQADNRDAQIRRSYYPNGQLKADTLRTRTVAETSAGGDFTSHVYGTLSTYDRNGRRTSLQHPHALAPRPGGQVRDVTRFGYDPVEGALSQVTDPLGNLFRYHYDVRGQQDTTFLPGGITQVYTYDNDGRPVHHRVINGATAPSAYRYPGAYLRDEVLSYDLGGKTIRVRNVAGLVDTVTFSYNALGQLASSTAKTRGYAIQTQQGATYSTTEVPSHDALGNVIRMSRSGTVQVYPGTWLDGSFTGTNWGTTVWDYQAGTGRLLLRANATSVDSTFYDSAGNVTYTKQEPLQAGQPRFDRNMLYDASGQLRVAETRRVADGFARSGAYYFTFEEYRYDALGRRVWVMARKGCDFGISNNSTRPCGVGSLRRTVWDGSAELYEIVRPVSSELSGDPVVFSTAEMESDTARIRGNLGRWDTFDPYVMWGHVAYTYGHAIDKPIGVVRMNYADNPYGTTGGLLRWTEPFALVPHWNLRGAAQSGTFASDGGRDRCQSYNGETRCVQIDWPDGWFPYNPVPQLSEYWFGTLLTDKRDGSGLLYRRNRYYDPSAARFTQEDPIGLAGGLNVYGFAAGDPVSFSDPYGLFPCIGSFGRAAATALLLAGSDAVLPIGDVAAVGCLLIASAAILATSNAIEEGSSGVARDNARTNRRRMQIHHIATPRNSISSQRGGPWTPAFEPLFERAGMSMEHPLNKVGVEGHYGPHPEAYHAAVYGRLVAATSGLDGADYRRAFVAELRAIGVEVATRGTPLNRLISR